MENYSKGENVEEPLDVDKVPIANLPKDLVWMQVRGGSKIRNLLEIALKAYQNESKDVLWTGFGPSIGKTITCAEIFKRRCKHVHQFNHICYRKCEEYWEPKVEGLDRLVVNRDVPMIHILLSHDAINQGTPGYQGFEESEGKRPKNKPKSKPSNLKEMEKFGLRFDKKKKPTQKTD